LSTVIFNRRLTSIDEKYLLKQRLIAPRYLVAEAETDHHWTLLLISRGYMLRFLQNRP